MDGRMAAVINEGLAHYQQQIQASMDDKVYPEFFFQPLPNRNAREEPIHHFFSSSLPKNSAKMGSRRHTHPIPAVSKVSV